MYTHKWRLGDVVIWDSGCSYHKATADYPPEKDRTRGGSIKGVR